MSTRAERKARANKRRCRNCGEYKARHYVIDEAFRGYICEGTAAVVPYKGPGS